MIFSERTHSMPTQPTRRRSRWLPWLVLVATLCLTWLLWQNARDQVERELQAEFNYSVQEAVRHIELRMQTYRTVLQGLQGLFASSMEVSRDEFSTYVTALELKARYPGIQSLGYSAIVPPEKMQAHIARMRREGLAEYDIRPAGKRDLVTATLYIEPFSGLNPSAIGYDMYSEPVNRVAMQRALETNMAALSGKVVLQHGNNDTRSNGFVLFLPIYDNQHSTDRKTVAKGWVHAQIKTDEMMAALAATHRNRIDLVIYDGTEVSAQTRLTAVGATPAASATRAHRLRTTKAIEFAGHVWTLEAASLPALENRFDRDKPRIILFSGIGASLLLALLMQMLIHGRAHAMRMAEDMNSALIKSEYRWKFALEGAGEGVWDWNLETGSVFLSARMKEMFGYETDDQLGDINSARSKVHPDDLQSVVNARVAYFEGKTPGFEATARVLCKDQGWKWCLIRGMVVSRDWEGKPLRMIGTLADISERHKNEESLRLAATVLETMNEALLVTGADNLIISVNPSFTQITGYTPDEVIGKDPAMLSDGVLRPDLVETMKQSLKSTGSWMGEIVNRRKTGELYVAWAFISSVRNTKDEVTNFVCVFSDISERKAIEQRMQYLAHFDPLTELPNRSLFHDRLRQALATCRRNQTHLALLFVDLDKFKPINDTLGHGIGDLLLREVAYRLLDSIRESDTAARIGGDEFVVLLPGIDTEQDAVTVAEKILAAIRQSYTLGEHTVEVSASIGIAIYPEDGLNDEAILTNADNAMYHAKHSGGSSIATFSQIHAKASPDKPKST